jgi:hypothetical protein
LPTVEWEGSEGGSLFAPSILTPEQFYDERRDDSAMRPIKRLMLAVLEDALRCLQKHADAKSGARRMMYWEAEQWLCSERGNALFSFTMVCETLGIEADYLRSGLLQWRRMTPRGELGQRVARRSPVVRNGSIITEGTGHTRRVRSRRRRDRRLPVR